MAFNRPYVRKRAFLCPVCELKRCLIQILVALMLCARSDSLLLFADWAVTVREWQGIAVYSGGAVLCGRQNPSDKLCASRSGSRPTSG